MSKIKKTDLLQLVQEQAEMIAELSAMVELNKMSIIKLENERDIAKELTGSDLARAMLANASKPIMCAVSDISTSKAMSLGNYDLIHDYTDEHSFMSLNQTWVYAIPINNQGEPLTASEAGL